ncbi:MAG: hypothetical protein JNN07_13015 [Verrucomicrobiales bacterium]|nr:hypothetical protein [Verrucomicrobiales bacterium]
MHRIYKQVLTVVAVLLLALSGLLQRSLDVQRLDPVMGLKQAAILENAPPLLAFTSVALGSFRGLIANALWIRATQLQEQSKFFEMVQLSDWITKLEPRIPQVWSHMAWNMAYNISVRFTSPTDRWRWVMRAVELLRDEGLRYNPTEADVYRELGWFFQHKIGYFLDEAHLYYKGAWYAEMNTALGGAATNITMLVNPDSDELKQRAESLYKRYKLDPALMAEVESKYGRMEWRLPDPHAIYWGYLGLKNCTENPGNRETLVTLRRLIYQSLHSLVLRGRIINFTKDGRPQTAPDLDLIPVANQGYLEMIKEEKTVRVTGIDVAYRNFLREVVYQLYVNNRNAEAEQWFQQLRQRFPDFTEEQTEMEPYALIRLKEIIDDGNVQRIKPIILGFLKSAFSQMSILKMNEALRYETLARVIYEDFQKRFGYTERVRLQDFEELRKEALRELLDPETGLYPELQARLKTRLGIESVTNLVNQFKVPDTNMIYGVTNRVIGLSIDKAPSGPPPVSVPPKP